MIIENQKISRNEINLDPQPSRHKRSFKKRHTEMKAIKEVRQSNEANRSNPILLDEASIEASSSKSFIDDLAVSAIKDQISQD